MRTTDKIIDLIQIARVLIKESHTFLSKITYPMTTDTSRHKSIPFGQNFI